MQHLKSSVYPLIQSYEASVINKSEDKKQQLEKQFHKIYRNFLILSQIFLSAPMGLQKSRREWQHKDVILNRLHILWCLGVYTWFAYCIYTEGAFVFIELPAIQKPLYFSEYFVYLIHLLECIRLIYFRRDTFLYFQTLILNFDKTLMEMRVPVHYDDIHKFLCYHELLILFNFGFCVVICYFYANYKVVHFFASIMVYVVPNVIINVSLLQYYAPLYFVYKRGEKLYFHLNRLIKIWNSNDIFKFRQDLHMIRSMFAKLDRFTKKINDHYSIFICLVYLGSFINTGINIFLLYKYFNAVDNLNSVLIVFSLAWTFMHFGKMSLILYYNQEVQNMKCKTTVLLSSFKFEYPGAETTFRLFILQLMSDTRSNYVCGLLALDMKFITSLAMSISTLFIFLVQYDITFEALMGTHNSVGPK